jgi:hypothetical protein
MAADISIKIDASDVARTLSAFAKQIPYATALAMTATAKDAVEDLKAEMRRVFDRPNNFTMNAFYAKPARKTDLTATVMAREWAPGGRPASKYLAPEIEGGARGMKGFEKALSGISGGQYAMPGKDARLDANGNMSRGQIVQILSRLGALYDPLQNMTDRTTARLRRKGMLVAASGMKSDMFLARENRVGRPYGIYQLIGPGRVAQLLVFTTKRPTYKAILPFGSIVANSVGRTWPSNVSKAIDAALKTARAE